LREKLEQLRALAHGMQIRVALAIAPPGVDVNTVADLERIREQLEGGQK
jgi:CMP-2-keto-3-deoxyoctulosonic acid synthetase